MKAQIVAALLLVGGSAPAWAAGYNELNAGISYLNQGRYADAVTWLDKAIAGDDLLPDQLHVAHVDRGRAHARLRNPEKAISDFSAALAIRPGEVLTLTERAFAFVAVNQADKALSDLSMLQAKRPNDVYLNFELGLVNWQLDRYEQARAAFERASNDSGQAYAWLWLQIANIKQSKPATPFRGPKFSVAGMHMRGNLKIGWPDAIISYYGGDGNEADVLQAAKDAGETAGVVCEANFYLAQLRILRGDEPGARPMMERAAKDCPEEYIEYRMAHFEAARLK